MDIKTRQRLAGLALMVVLAVIIAPLLFRTPTEVRVALDMTLPEPPVVEAVPLEPAVDADEQEQALEAVNEAQQSVVERAEEAPERPVLAPAEAPDQAAIPTGWMVQVGSFTGENSARALDQKLRDADYPAFVREVEQDGQRLFRVFAGPELSREAAEKLKKQLASDRRFKLSGFVTPYSL